MRMSVSSVLSISNTRVSTGAKVPVGGVLVQSPTMIPLCLCAVVWTVVIVFLAESVLTTTPHSNCPTWTEQSVRPSNFVGYVKPAIQMLEGENMSADMCGVNTAKKMSVRIISAICKAGK